MAKEQNKLSIPANENRPDTFSKYEATVIPQGKDTWTIVIEDVKYFAAAPAIEQLRSTVFRTESFNGSEEDARAVVCERMKKLVEDRDAINTAKQFTITEDDIDG